MVVLAHVYICICSSVCYCVCLWYFVGPVIITVDANDAVFRDYVDGVFRIGENKSLRNSQTTVSRYTPPNHAVLCTGYGNMEIVEPGSKPGAQIQQYLICKNSWGTEVSL